MIHIQTEWWLFLQYVLVITGLFLLVSLFGKMAPKFIKRSTARNRFVLLYKRFRFVFIIMASVLLLLTFVRVNYIVHGGFLILLIVILFPFIRSLLHGVVIQMNGMMQIGMLLQTGKYQGEIKKFTPLGILINNAQGQRFVNYIDLHKKGFSSLNKEDGRARSNIIIKTTLSDEAVIDLLFETPFINHKEMPELRKHISNDKGTSTLYFTLQDGTQQETLYAYLIQNQIEIVTKY